MTLGEKVKVLRKKANLTIEKLAEKSNMSVATIVGIEKDRLIPGVVGLKKLSEALKCNYEKLFELCKK